jgi:tRNA U34 2-thiouridine synthase MnmA/TrmU
MLAIRILQEQGVEVEAINFQTVFTCCKDTAAQAARELGVRLTVLSQQDDYIELVRKPKHGYGKGANPCVDCRIYMFQLAAQYADQTGADVIVSGEVVGQRPMSQKKRDLLLISRNSDLERRLLRPLSAKLLPPTDAELDGRIDREKLYAFAGRGRKELIRLARHLGLQSIPSPSTGCALTEQTFAPKVHDLIQLDQGSQRWDFELLRTGRHIRINRSTKAIVGRREQENAVLQAMYRTPDSRASALLVPRGFPGASVMLVGDADETALQTAGALALRYAKNYDADNAVVQLFRPGEPDCLRQVNQDEDVNALATL